MPRQELTESTRNDLDKYMNLRFGVGLENDAKVDRMTRGGWEISQRGFDYFFIFPRDINNAVDELDAYIEGLELVGYDVSCPFMDSEKGVMGYRVRQEVLENV